MKVINNHRQPITLDSGVILAAAGTPGCEKEIESVSERDQRRYAGKIAIIDSEAPKSTRSKENNK